MVERRRMPLAPLALAAVALLYVCFGSVFVADERPNQDEGWYVYAARLVGAGKRPYVDFAYVQPPLLPYVYHRLGGAAGMSAGRSVSLLLGTLAVLGVGLAGWRGGPAGGLTAAALLAFTPFALSQQSIVKAYALADAWMAWGLFLAVGARGRRGWLAGSAAAFALAALSRNSALPALVALWLWLALDRERRRHLPLSLAVGVGLQVMVYLPFLLADAAAVRYDLIVHHARNAPHDPLVLAITLVAVGRLMVAACPAIAVALFAGLAAVVLKPPEEVETRPEIELALLMAAMVAVGQFVSGHPYQEYQVLALPAACVAAGLCWAEVLRRTAEARLVTALLAVLVAAVPVLALGPAMSELPGARMGEQGVFGPLRRVAAAVQRCSASDDELFCFQTDVAVEAHRRLVPGLTLASFSFADEADAERFHLVNAATIQGYLEEARPAVVVLSPGDLANLLHGEWTADDRIRPQPALQGPGLATYGPLCEALDRNYELVERVDQVGQFFERFDVLRRRDGAPFHEEARP